MKIKILDDNGQDITDFVRIIYEQPERFPVVKKTLKDYINANNRRNR